MVTMMDENEHTQLRRLLTELRLQCRTCIAILRVNFDDSDSLLNAKPQTPEATALSLKKLLSILDSDLPVTIRKLYEIAACYDYKEIRANGIRSFLALTSKCCAQLLTYLRKMNTYSISNWSGVTERFIISYIDCLAELQTCLNVLTALPQYSNKGCLFPRCEYVDLPEIGSCDTMRVTKSSQIPSDDQSIKPDVIIAEEEKQKMVEFYRLEALSDQIKQEHFYGRCLGFYFCTEAQRILQFLNSLMAGYGNSYLGSKQGIASIVSTVYWSVSSYLSPEDRGRAIAKLTRKANVQFCKTFWNLAENRFVAEAPTMLQPSMAVVHSFQLEPVMLRMPTESSANNNRSNSERTEDDNQEFISIDPPSSHIGLSPLTLHLLSLRPRPGTEWIHSDNPSVSTPQSPNPTDSATTSSSFHRTFSWVGTKTPTKEQLDNGTAASPRPPCNYLLFYIHGGGFIALNSHSQTSVLRTWAEHLDCPILSIDYSLAPEAPYPRALEECYYAYCWAALNRERLGATPDAKIILGGDSAGGNLVLGVCLKAARERIVPRPSAAMLAYTPILIAFAPSPSRLLSLCDPLLPIGVLSKCLLAYAGVDESALEPDSTQSLNIVDQTFENQSTRSSDSPSWRRWLIPSWFDSTEPEELGRLRKSSHPNPLQSTSASAGRLTEPTRHISVPSVLSGMSSMFKSPPPSPTTAFQKPMANHSETTTMTTTAHPDDQTNPNPQINHDTPVQFNLNSDCKPTSTPRRPPTDLNRVREIHFPQDAFMSPYLASDEMIRQLPPLGIVCSKFDPFLDDCLELAKRASSVDVPVEVQIVDNLPHAFLNFSFLGPEFQHGNNVCIKVFKHLKEHILAEDL